MNRTLVAPIVAVLLALLAPAAHAQPGADDGVAIEDLSGVDCHGSFHEQWLPLTASGRHLEPDAFYRRLGREDLVAARHQRRYVAVGSLVGGIALTGAAIYLGTSSHRNCDLNDPQFSMCVDQNARDSGTNAAMVAGTLALGGAAFAISTWYFLHPEPISEAEAEELAAEHNARVQLAPYASPTGGGVAVAGRF